MRSIALLLVLLIIGSSAMAQPEPGYPTPQQAGFHHCALIYEKAQRGVPEFLPLVARRQEGKAAEWLFDSYLFLTFTSPRGIGTSDGQTNRGDWQHQLDQWFAPGRDLAALDRAIELAAGDLGAPPPERQVMLSIPYLHPAVKDFGDVDGDGRSEDLSTPAGRDTVVHWYLTEAKRRFAAAGYRHLQLWGFYWMNEGVSEADAPTVRAVAAQVHRAGDRFLWIPWYQAPGWERWRELGFDVALMQPNYAFSATHHGKVRRNRLAVTAELARSHGLGVEMEAGVLASNAADQHAFLQYLADGAPGRLGYQHAATAYYLNVDTVERVLASPQPEVRGLYDALAAYVAGRTVASPDPPLRWITDRGATLDDYLGPARAASSAETRLESPFEVGMVDVFLDEPDANRPWQGTVEVQAKGTDDARWQPAGWAMRAGHDASSGRWQVVTLPVNRRALALRVNLRPAAGQELPLVRGIVVTPGAALPEHPHRALNQPYQLTPAPMAKYGDSGHELTDGMIPDTGFASGKTIGWINTGVAIRLDLGRIATVSGIEVHCQGGGYAGVNWPEFACAITSATAKPPAALSGTGPLPGDVQWLLPAPIAIDRQRSGNDMDGHLSFRGPAAPARYINLVLDGRGWLMLSEVRVFEGTKNIAPQASYTLRPPPTSDAASNERYADDGRRLTDGIIAAEFSPDQVTGWMDGPSRQAVVDLGSAQPVRRATAWCLGGGLAGIYAPAQVQFEVSPDGKAWRELGAAGKPEGAEDGKRCFAVPYRVEAAAEVSARFVRATIARDKGWAMVSEIEVPEPAASTGSGPR